VAQTPKDGKLLYHLTALDNLESIIINDLQPRQGIQNFVDVADYEILQGRNRFDLELYTPFHFFSSSPFSGKVQKDNPEKEFVYLALKRDLAEISKFMIVPSHPLHYKGEPLNWNEGIQQINWDLLAMRDYSIQECKEACMAESIFKGRIAIKYFYCIYVRTIETKSKVEELLRKQNCAEVPFVSLNSGMFINHD